ncbi:hypothetical protein L3073_09470 [Ancylomarina sp. DW003]|nr:hypothetical protein [Ancylomarina sp. DW003]MDE5422434.1 hypothetical protein [Ancylomarina sp. DW003]
MKNKLFIVVLCLSAMQIQAQNVDSLLKEKNKAYKSLSKQRDKIIKDYKIDFERYVSEEDHKFAIYLKKRWTEFQVFSGKEIPTKPKPTIPPVFVPNSNINRLDPIKLIVDSDIELIDNSNLIEKSEIPIPREPNKNKTNRITVLEFDFFGREIILGMDPALISSFEKAPSEIEFSEYWTKAARADYPYVINQLIKYSNAMKLNDWAYYMLVDKLSKQIHPEDNNSKELLTWFILVKSGYNAKIGYNANDVSLLLASKQQIFRYPYVSLNGCNYYLPKSLNSTISTYKKDFEGSNELFNVSLYKSPNLGAETKTRNLSFNYRGENHSLAFDYQPSLIAFYNEYPVVDFTTYFNASVSELTHESIVNQLKPILDNKSELEQVEILLTFIHQAFPYQTDEEQFGREKYFFVEDIFSYPYSDCEDRSVLFTYLVRSLVGLNTLGLKTTGHVFTAVELENVRGDYVDYKRGHYIVCDPTYMGASVGVAMPDVLNQNLKIIP